MSVEKKDTDRAIKALGQAYDRGSNPYCAVRAAFEALATPEKEEPKSRRMQGNPYILHDPCHGSEHDEIRGCALWPPCTPKPAPRDWQKEIEVGDRVQQKNGTLRCVLRVLNGMVYYTSGGYDFLQNVYLFPNGKRLDRAGDGFERIGQEEEGIYRTYLEAGALWIAGARGFIYLARERSQFRRVYAVEEKP